MRAFIFQSGQGFASVWDDSELTYNLNPNPGLGFLSNTNLLPDPKVMVSFFRKVDNRFILSDGVDADLCLTRPYTSSDTLPPIRINLQDIVDEYEKIKDRPVFSKSLLFGVPLDNATDQKSAIESTRFFSRLGDGSIFDHKNDSIIDESFNIIPWFLCYKVDEAPIYYIVLNHYAIQETSSLSGWINDDDFVYSIDNHSGTIDDLFFEPTFSRNVKVIGNQLLVTGDKFTVSMFEGWFVKLHLDGKDLFKDAKVKCSTNMPFTRDKNQFEVTVDKTTGYLYLRWNSSTRMDLAHHNTARFYREYVIHKI